MDVILHVGAHRTATTTFQHHLAANRGALRAARATYWGPKVVRGGLFRTMSGGTDPILPWQAKRAAKRAALRSEALRQDGIKRLIISDENMLGSLRNVLEDTLLYPGAGRRIAEFAQGFQKHNLTIGLGVRCYSHWWTSALAFRLMRGGPLPRADLRERMVTQPRRWRHIVEEIARAVPDARLVVWTHEALSSAPHLQLHALADIATIPASLPILNAAPRGTEVRRFMTDCGLNAEEFTWPDNRFMPFEMHEADALRAQYQDDLTWLAEGAGGSADYIDAMSAQTDAQTVEGRGSSDDGEHRYLA
ncbi:hypothetical protein [Gymnodinialimonas hymeniacidonis]|uniref:hypothetical protein n=1 Tax=Gymnodinialimonas hymeniacidonis TaxID=3126508 RepID=UPI0034C62DED